MENDVLKRIKELRLKKGWTAAELSDKMGFGSQSAYSKIEQGFTDLKFSHIVQLASIFGVAEAELLGLEGAGAHQVRELEYQAREYGLYKVVATEYIHQLLWELAALKGVARDQTEEAPCREFFRTEVVTKLFKTGMVTDRQLLSLWERYGVG